MVLRDSNNMGDIMNLKLHNSETVKYTVVTTYEDGYKAYSVATEDPLVAEDHVKKLKRGLFGANCFAKIAEIDMIKETTTVKEETMAISKF